MPIRRSPILAALALIFFTLFLLHSSINLNSPSVVITGTLFYFFFGVLLLVLSIVLGFSEMKH